MSRVVGRNGAGERVDARLNNRYVSRVADTEEMPGFVLE